MDEQLYEIQDGVRRAKAAWLCGRETIEAQINGGPIFPVPFRCLRSPHKDEIDVSGLGGIALGAGLAWNPIRGDTATHRDSAGCAWEDH